MSSEYGWCQGYPDPAGYDSQDSPEEQRRATIVHACRLLVRGMRTRRLIAAMRAAVAEVPSYCEQYARAAQAEREEAARVIQNRRQMLQTRVCDHGHSLSLCPECSDLA